MKGDIGPKGDKGETTVGIPCVLGPKGEKGDIGKHRKQNHICWFFGKILYYFL
jgi:hypothetical protein